MWRPNADTGGCNASCASLSRYYGISDLADTPVFCINAERIQESVPKQLCNFRSCSYWETEYWDDASGWVKKQSASAMGAIDGFKEKWFSESARGRHTYRIPGCGTSGTGCGLTDYSGGRTQPNRNAGHSIDRAILFGTSPKLVWAWQRTRTHELFESKQHTYVCGGHPLLTSLLLIPVIGSTARGDQRLNCSMRCSTEPRNEQFSR